MKLSQETQDALMAICNRAIAKTLAGLENNNCPVHLWRIVDKRLRYLRGDIMDLFGIKPEERFERFD